MLSPMGGEEINSGFSGYRLYPRGRYICSWAIHWTTWGFFL